MGVGINGNKLTINRGHRDIWSNLNILTKFHKIATSSWRNMKIQYIIPYSIFRVFIYLVHKLALTPLYSAVGYTNCFRSVSMTPGSRVKNTRKIQPATRLLLLTVVRMCLLKCRSNITPISLL